MTIQAYVVFFSLAIFAFLTPSLSHILHSTIPLQIKPRRRLENLSHPICCFKLTATPCFAFDLKKWIPWPVFQAFYTRSQLRFPRATFVAQGVFLSTLGDIISQEISRSTEYSSPETYHKSRYNLKRLGIAAVAGFVFDGFVIPTWYSILNTIVPAHTQLRSLIMTLLDICILSTCGNTASLMLRNSLLNGSLVKAWKETKAQLLVVIMVDLKIFPAYDLLLFQFVPKKFQALCTAFVCCLWNCYLSTVTAAIRTKRMQKHRLDNTINI